MTTDSRNRLQRFIVTAVLVATGIIFLALPVLALRWTQLPFAGLLFDPNLVINSSSEPTWPSRQGDDPLLYPDRLVAIDGIAVGSVRDVTAVLANKQIGQTATFTLAQPDAASGETARFDAPSREKPIVLERIGLGGLWDQFWFFYITGLILWMLGCWVYWVRPEAEAAQIFALYMAFVALAVGLLFDSRTTHLLIRLWLFALSLTCGLTVLFTAVFPHPGRLLVRAPWLRIVILLPGLLVGIWVQFILFDPQAPWAYVDGWRLLYLLNGLGLLFSISMMVYRAVRSPSAQVQQQARTILTGAVLGYTPIIFFFVASFQGIDTSFFPQIFFIPLIVLYPAAISYTILRYRLWGTDDILRHGLTYGILVVGLIAAMTIVVLALTAVFGSALNNPVLLAAFVVLLILIFDPLRQRLQTSVDDLLFKQPLTMDDMLRDYNRELTTAVTEDQVASMMLLYVRTAIPEANPDLYLPDGEMSSYRSYYKSNNLQIGADAPLILGLKKMHGAIELVEEQVWPTLFKKEKETVQAMNTAVIVPMYNEQDLLGWLSLSPKTNNGRFTQNELAYLTALADQSLIGFERASVVRSLEARVYEQDMLSQFSQALNFTIDLDDLMELVYTNYERLFNLSDFFIYLYHNEIQQNYTAFYLEDGQRKPAQEGLTHLVEDGRVLDVFTSGQFKTGKNEANCTWMAVPLNAGRGTLGVIFTYYRKPGLALRPRQKQLFITLADQTATALARLETNRQLQNRAQQLETINEVTFSLATTMDLNVLLELILDKAMELLHTEAGTFMVTDLDTGELEFRVARGPNSAGLLGTRLPVGKGLAGTVAQTGQPIIANAVQQDKRWFGQVGQDTAVHTRALLTVPLLHHNSVWGIIQLINKANGAPFTEEDQSLLTTFASQAVVAMENARLLAQTDEALRKSVNELSLLTQLDRDLNTSLDVEHVLNLALDRTLSIYDGIAGAIVLVDEDGRPYRMISRGYDELVELEDIADGRGLVGQVIKTRQPHLTNNVHEEPAYVAANFATKSQMTLPIQNTQQLLGVLVIESGQLEAFDDDAVETAVRLTNHASIALANALLVEQVKAANEAKSDFVTMVSHELKTPMTSMRGYTDLLLSGITGTLTDQQKNFLDVIAANIRRMSQQIQDLTDISRIETGKLHIKLAATPFDLVVSETLQIVQAICDEKEIKLQLKMPQDLPPVMADKERLVQVLTNLLSNACKYSPPKTEVLLGFDTRYSANGKGNGTQPFVVCKVQDQGYGISAEDRKKLFTKFFRSDDPNIRQAKGTGLGLSITRGIIELHNGEIWVESEVGQGTTFAFTIPQATAVAPR